MDSDVDRELVYGSREHRERALRRLTELNDPRLQRLADYVRDHLEERLSLREAADIVGLERTHLSRVFGNVTGEKFSEWIRFVRVEESMELLSSTRKRITSIALSVGYRDLTTFGRAFKRCTGMCPRDYRKTHTRRTARAFTLVELLVVIAILGLLAGLVGPQVMRQFGGAKADAASLQVSDFGAALDVFLLDVGRYPTTNEGLEALVRDPGAIKGWNGPYLRKTNVPLDPWGQRFQYVAPGDHGPYDLYSLGADNRSGGEGNGTDIVSWD